DAGSLAHGYDEEQTPVTGKESKHTLTRCNPIHNEVDALGEEMLVAGAHADELVVVVHIRPAGIDKPPGADRKLPTTQEVADTGFPALFHRTRTQGFHVIHGYAACAHAAADKAEYKAGIVIRQVAVGVLQAAHHFLY